MCFQWDIFEESFQDVCNSWPANNKRIWESTACWKRRNWEPISNSLYTINAQVNIGASSPTHIVCPNAHASGIGWSWCIHVQSTRNPLKISQEGKLQTLQTSHIEAKSRHVSSNQNGSNKHRSSKTIVCLTTLGKFQGIMEGIQLSHMPCSFPVKKGASVRKVGKEIRDLRAITLRHRGPKGGSWVYFGGTRLCLLLVLRRFC